MQELGGKAAVLEATRRILPLLERFEVRAQFVSGERAVLVYDFVCKAPIGVCRTAEMVAFKGLWLCDSTNSLWLALVLGTIVAWPRIASRGLVMLLALGPVASAVAVYATMGSFFAGHLLLLSGALALAAGALSH